MDVHTHKFSYPSFLNKMNSFNDDIKDIRINRSEINVTSVNVEKSSVVKTSENENIKISIEEPDDNQEEFVESDEDDINPHLITCSEIVLEPVVNKIGRAHV